MQSSGVDAFATGARDEDPSRMQEAVLDAQYPEVKPATTLGQVCR